MITAKWILIAVFLTDGVPVESGMLGTASEADCKVALEISIKHGHGKGLDVWAECREIAPITKKPLGEPGTRQSS